MHRSVLLTEAVDGLALRADARIVDCTFGRGGHSQAILDRLGPAGRLLAFDKDPLAIAWARSEDGLDDARFELVYQSFSGLGAAVDARGWRGQVAGVLMDLGVSSPQLDDPSRGFSFLRDGPLDMRMDTGRGMSAADWLAEAREDELARVIRDFGEERYARRVAQAIVARRAQGRIETTGDLARLVEKAMPRRDPFKHPATRTFQAIRIHINGELDELAEGLKQAVDVLNIGGRLVVIAFHSLEDRIVKRFIRDRERSEVVRGLPAPPDAEPTIHLRRVGKKLLPTAAEIDANPRARSAVLRVAERVAPT